ncbi:uncharacterized protein I303_103936 [Kwoniella dejecticola CBS 10117]|uniref:Ion transport domain-containing protein n=1 Tax=Kwoniella dejecticola CBS 10117 TaxID=1296121 RepID=A0A1A6A854_9TREE|nr:uncharacterized protein I303_03953 [Kwoniella dejecticola CBS 10117]OBR86233.1 hypothetical protein I303_03953 [Kwoniella dejecticola CBS 10117]
MSLYPPGSSSEPLPAEEYELPDIEAGPSKRRSSNSAPKARTLTLHPTTSTANLLFSAPNAALPTPKRRHARTQSYPDSPEGAMTPRRLHRDAFLSEEDQRLNDAEEVNLPDFGHMLGFNDEGEDHFAIAQGMRTRWKRKLYLLLEEPNSGREAFFIHIAVTGTIIFSAILTTLSTLPAFHTNPASTRALFGLDTFIVILFTIEYLARSLAHSDSWLMYYNWSTSFFAILDIIAILPYYIEVAQNEDTSILFRFSILRTFRLLRVFRAFKYQNQMLLTIEVMYVAVRRSKDALLALSFFILLVLILSSTLLYFAERGTWDNQLGAFIDSDGEPSQFDSIPKTAWFSLVTMSTVGYGEITPKSFMGKLITVPLLMFGLLLIALPSFVLGRNFAIVFDAMTARVHKPPSNISSPRSSLEVPPPPSTLLQKNQSAPLLNNFSSTSTPVGPLSAPVSRSRAVSPLPPSGNMVPSSSASSARGINNLPKMWDGGDIPQTSNMSKGDLTNVKLAKNQFVLLEQIDNLRKTIDRQGDLLSRLAAALDVKEGRSRQSSSRTEGGSDTKKHDIDEKGQFALGESDEEGDH